MKKIFMIMICLIFVGCATAPPLDPGYEMESKYIMLSSKEVEIDLRRSDFHAIELFMELGGGQFIPLPCKLRIEADTVTYQAVDTVYFQYTYDSNGKITIWYEDGLMVPKQVLFHIIIIKN